MRGHRQLLPFWPPSIMSNLDGDSGRALTRESASAQTNRSALGLRHAPSAIFWQGTNSSHNQQDGKDNCPRPSDRDQRPAGSISPAMRTISLSDSSICPCRYSIPNCSSLFLCWDRQQWQAWFGCCRKRNKLQLRVCGWPMIGT